MIMQPGKALREIGLLVLGLGIVGLVTAAIIASLRGHSSGETLVTATPISMNPAKEPTTEIPYP
jgi:hypothetical protein